MNLITKILKEPFFHFLILGGVLFATYSMLNPEDSIGKEKIIIEQSQINYLAKRFEVRQGRKPTQEELKLIVENAIDTEVYYREALALGLDKNDDIIKKHLRKKMELLSQNNVSLLDIKDSTLQDYMNRHKKAFTLDSMYRFYQVYIDPNKHDNLKAYLAEVKNKLDANEEIKSDSKMMRWYYAKVSKEVVSDIFGDSFTKYLNESALGVWTGPFKSKEGLHFIKIIKRTKKRMVKLDEMRQYVLAQYSKEQYRKKLAKDIEAYRSKYDIVIEDGNISK